MRKGYNRPHTNKIGIRTLSRKQKVSGRRGESSVASVLSQLPSYYIVINNVLLKQGSMKIPYINGQEHIGKKVSNNGETYEIVQRTTQIDHVVVSPFGIFVIETKNHSGMIFGDQFGKYWTQVLIGLNKRTTFANPVAQNDGHIKALSKALNLPVNCMTGFVVFANEKANIIKVHHLCCDINSLPYIIENYNRPLWTMQDTMNIAKAIQEMNSSSKYNDAKHVKYVNRLKEINGGM